VQRENLNTNKTHTITLIK